MSEGHVDARRTLVARALLTHRTAEQIAEQLAALPLGERPAAWSVASIRRDIQAIREEWARERRGLVDRVTDEDLARFAEIEAVLLPECRKGVAQAIDRWLRLQAARAQLLGLRSAAAAEAASAQGAAVGIELRVHYVDDWRAVRAAAIGGAAYAVSGGDGPALTSGESEVGTEEEDGGA